LVNFSILYLHDRYALHANWHLQTYAQKRFSLCSRKRPFTIDAVSAAEDGVGFSFGIRAEFTCFAKNSVKKFESERMLGESELFVKLICGRNEVPLSPGC